MVEKVAVVTGGNKGIGFATVKNLCKEFKGIVYLCSRDEQRGKAAVAELEKQGLSPKFHQLDIDNMESITKFRDYLKSTHGGIDVLVNNAAIAFKSSAKETFAEQSEPTIRVNYFGCLNVCEELIPLFRPHGRLVNVSSCVGHLSKVSGKEPQAAELRKKLASDDLTIPELNKMMKEFVKLAQEGKHLEAGWGNSNYGMSKVGLSALTRIYQRHFDTKHPEEDLVANSCHPGYVDTDMTSHQGPLTPDEGSVASVYLALLPPNVKEPRGAYVWKDKQIVDWVNGPLPAPGY